MPRKHFAFLPIFCLRWLRLPFSFVISPQSNRMDPSIMAWMGMQNQQPNQSQNQLQIQPHQPSASQFHLLRLIEGLADAVEGGVRDQHSDMLVNELTAQFEKCQQLLNTFAGPNDTMTLRGQKQKLEEYERQLNNRRDLIMKYKSIVENHVGPS